MTYEKTVWLPRLALAGAMALLPALLSVAARPDNVGDKPAEETVEMFSAIERGQIDVKLIPKDSTLCRVMIENKTNRPLTVKLPDAFAGVPVLAQGGMLGGNAGGNRGGNTGNRGGGNQGMGGGMGGMGMGGMGGGGMGGMGGGMFNVAPEKVGQFKVTTVCLDHGKADPRPGVKYEIRPIEAYSDKPSVREVCQMLGNGAIPQRAAQAAAWHLNNNMSWEQLAAKQLRFANGTNRPYFSPEELQTAMQISTKATILAEQRKDKERSKQASASQN